QYISFKSHARKSRSFESVQKMKKGLTEDEIKECYVCHTMGYGKPGGFISPEKTPELKNAGCEVCHGPGSIHIKTEDPAYIIRDVTINICQECHIEERVKAFRYKPIIYAGSH
ncbi:MAG: cytochrome C, partial [Desulfobacterales bacterium PC51MH44]